jgi:hypothetical protein
MKFHGGCTIILGPEGEVRYIVSKNARNQERLNRQMDYQRTSGYWLNEGGRYRMRGYAHQLVHQTCPPSS